MKYRTLQEAAYEANMALVRHGLVIFTWGNASARDFGDDVMAIKPSGVAYDQLKPEDMVIVNITTGQSIGEQRFRPSSDTPTHCCLYQAFKEVGGLVHTHSRRATAWAQAGLDLPCFGTTHADYFCGSIPCTAEMTPEEISGARGYEWMTGEVIAREFAQRRLDPRAMPAVLVRGHAPFVWGREVGEAVHNAVVLEEVAGMALQTRALNPSAPGISDALLEKHFKRKHGPEAYYGQKSGSPSSGRVGR